MYGISKSVDDAHCENSIHKIDGNRVDNDCYFPKQEGFETKEDNTVLSLPPR